MRDDYSNPATEPKMPTAPTPDDGIPVLREIVSQHEGSNIPIVNPNLAVTVSDTVLPDTGMLPERLAELTDTLQLTLNRELDYAIDGAVYERLQTAMEEVAASVKQQVHAQLEQRLPELIEQALRKEH